VFLGRAGTCFESPLFYKTFGVPIPLEFLLLDFWYCRSREALECFQNNYISASEYVHFGHCDKVSATFVDDLIATFFQRNLSLQDFALEMAPDGQLERPDRPMERPDRQAESLSVVDTTPPPHLVNQIVKNSGKRGDREDQQSEDKCRAPKKVKQEQAANEDPSNDLDHCTKSVVQSLVKIQFNEELAKKNKQRDRARILRLQMQDKELSRLHNVMKKQHVNRLAWKARALAAEERLNSLQAHNLRAEEKLKSAEAERFEAVEQLKQARGEIKHARADSVEATRKNAELLQQLQAQQLATRQANEQAENAQRMQTQIQQRCQVQQQQVQRLSQRYTDLEKVSNGLQAQVQTLQQQNLTLADRVRELSDKLLANTKELERERQNVEDARYERLHEEGRFRQPQNVDLAGSGAHDFVLGDEGNEGEETGLDIANISPPSSVSLAIPPSSQASLLNTTNPLAHSPPSQDPPHNVAELQDCQRLLQHMSQLAQPSNQHIQHIQHIQCTEVGLSTVYPQQQQVPQWHYPPAEQLTEQMTLPYSLAEQQAFEKQQLLQQQAYELQQLQLLQQQSINNSDVPTLGVLATVIDNPEHDAERKRKQLQEQMRRLHGQLYR
jgi:hypothetical protein